MRQVLDEQKYMDFTGETSLKVVAEYRAKYAWIDECLDANELILWLVHEDLESLSTSDAGREAKYTTEILFRALLVHQLEGTSLRETIVRIAESPTLQAFIRLGNRSVMDFTFLNRAFKAIKPETWKLVNEELAQHAVKKCDVDVSRIRTDSTVIETNIHYPTDSSLLWDSYRVLSRLLRAVREEAPELCPHRFHDKKAKKDLVYVHRYMRSGSKARRRELKRRFRRLLENVVRLQGIAKPLLKTLQHSAQNPAAQQQSCIGRAWGGVEALPYVDQDGLPGGRTSGTEWRDSSGMRSDLQHLRGAHRVDQARQEQQAGRVRSLRVVGAKFREIHHRLRSDGREAPRLGIDRGNHPPPQSSLPEIPRRDCGGHRFSR
jgi:hypothetical protein